MVPGQAAPSPKPLLDKLGVRPGDRVAVVGLDDPGFLAELRSRTGDVTVGRPKRDSDLIVIRIDRREDLDRATALQDRLVPAGAVWVIRPKGSPDIREVDIIEAGKRAGLVDNKIAAFSETLSAMRLVIPRSRRPRK